MSLPTKGLGRRAARSALLGLLLATTATAALAAPSDAKLQAMQRQLDELTAQIAQMKGAPADDSRLAALQQQIDDFAKQLADVQAAQKTADADIVTLKSPAVAVSLPNGKPALASSDKRFTANIRAIIMMDGGKYFQKHNLGAAVVGRDLNEGFNFRRARIGFDGKVFGDFDYSLVYDFGGSGAEDPGRLYEASITYTKLKPWRIKVGAFEPNIGLAAATSTSAMPLMERPSPAEMARGVAAGDSRVAAQLIGNGTFGSGDTGIAVRWLASSALTGNTIATISSSGGATTQPFDEQTAWIGRLAIAPFDSVNWQAHLGVNYQYVLQPNDATGGANPRYPVQLRDRPELRLDGTRLVDTGAMDANHATVMGAEAAFQVQGFLIESEAFRYKIDRRITALPALPDPTFNGWYVQGTWVLTGEQRLYDPAEGRFTAPKQNYNFNPAAGTFGAVELAARYSVLDLNYHEGAAGVAAPFGAVRGGEQKILALGANWYLNPDLRLMLNYLRVDVDHLNAAGAQIGQKYNAVAMRGQFTF